MSKFISDNKTCGRRCEKVRHEVIIKIAIVMENMFRQGTGVHFE